MDPYLEDPAFWEDFHDSFIVYWRDALNAILPNEYRARVNGRTRIVDLTAGEECKPVPDVMIHQGEDFERGGVATLQPVTLPLRFIEEERETYIEILRMPERTVVSALQLLSPSNKAGSGRRDYLAKRQAVLRQDVNLVELDLLRGRGRVPLLGTVQGEYFQYVSRIDLRPDCQVYGWGLRDLLPSVPLPLKPPDADAIVDLARVFAETFDRGCYREDLRYGQAPPADWPEADAAWICQTARNPRVRGSKSHLR